MMMIERIHGRFETKQKNYWMMPTTKCGRRWVREDKRWKQINHPALLRCRVENNSATIGRLLYPTMGKKPVWMSNTQQVVLIADSSSFYQVENDDPEIDVYQAAWNTESDPNPVDYRDRIRHSFITRYESEKILKN